MHFKTPTPHRVLVSGASGAIGTPACRHLLGRGHRLRGFALGYEPQNPWPEGMPFPHEYPPELGAL